MLVPTLGAAPLVCSSAPCLPSGDAAIDFVKFRPGLWPGDLLRVLSTMALRGALVGGGLYLAGARDKNLLKYTAAGTGAIEAFVLMWAAWRVYSKPKAQP